MEESEVLFMKSWERDLDRYLTTPPEPEERHCGYCEHCEGDIFEGEEIYKTSEGLVHEECFMEYAKEELDASWDIAEAPEPDFDDYYADREEL
jgi:hypothetical protein